MANEDTHHTGYDVEEAFFHKHDVELLESMRDKLNVDRASQQREHDKAEHWMRCPKCGGEMQEIEIRHLMVERCKQCSGTFFDRGELELLLHPEHAQKHASLLRRVLHRPASH